MGLRRLDEAKAAQTGHPEWAGHSYISYSAVVEVVALSEVPDIPLPDDISIEAIEAALGFTPLFATLPILKVDVTSRNGNTYARSSVEALVNQINQYHVEGLWGHLGFFESSSRTAPAIRWLAATLDETTGIAFGKCLIIDEDAVRHFKVAEATKSKVGVSLFGIDAVEDANGAIAFFNLASVDLVNAQMVGVGIASADPKLTTESIKIEGHMTEEELRKKEEERIAAEAAKVVKPAAQLAPATQQSIQEQIVEMAGNKVLREQINELKTTESAYNAVVEIFGLTGKPIEEVLEATRLIAQEHGDFRKENEELLESAIKSAIDGKVKMESAKPLIIEMVKSKAPTSRAQVATAVAEVLARPSVKGFLAEAVVTESGGKISLPDRHEIGGEGYKQFLEEKEA